jgi:uncharacterized membrane protein YbhN (UPF0104 family)
MRRLKFYLPTLLLFLAVGLLGLYVWENRERYQELLDISLTSLLLLGTLVGVFMALNGLTNYLLFRSLSVPLGLNESVGLAAVTTLGNQLPFAGGLVARGVYLKQRYDFGYTLFLSSTAALYICFVSVNGILGLVALTFLALVGTVALPWYLIVGFATMALSVLALVIPFERLLPQGWVRRRFRQVTEGWRLLRGELVALGLLMGVQILTTLLFGVRYWIAFRALSQEVAYAECILFSAATVLTRLVSVVPGGVGVREGIVAGIASILGFDTSISVVAVGIDRLVATSVIIAVGTVYTYVLSKKVGEDGR